jgi:glucan phosphorylase
MFFYQVIEALERNGIPYILTGGYAVALHGYIRKTFDIDIITDNTFEGLVEIEHALKECDLRPEKYSAQSIEKLKDIESSWYFINPKDETQKVDVHIQQNATIMSSQIKRIQTYKVPIITLDDLIQMKKDSEHEKDKVDLKFLLEIPR